MRGRRAAAAALAAAVLLTGCNGGNDDSSSPTTARSQPAPTSSSARITGGPFCERVLTFNNRFGRLGPDLANPEQLRISFEEAATSIEEAEGIAPPEIKSDVTLLATTFRELVTVLGEANYDFTRVPPDQLQRLQDPGLQAAGQRLDSYIRQNCRAG